MGRRKQRRRHCGIAAVCRHRITSATQSSRLIGQCGGTCLELADQLAGSAQSRRSKAREREREEEEEEKEEEEQQASKQTNNQASERARVWFSVSVPLCTLWTSQASHPIAVINDARVCPNEVEPEPASACGQQEHKALVVIMEALNLCRLWSSEHRS